MSTDQGQPQRSQLSISPLSYLSLAFICGIILASNLETTTHTWFLLSSASLVIWALFAAIQKCSQLIPAAITTSLSNIINNACALFTRIKMPLPVAFLFAALFLGAWRYEKSQPVMSPAQIAFYNDTGKILIIEGIVKKPPETLDVSQELIIQVIRVRPTYDLHFNDVEGMIQARVGPEGEWRYGDRVRLKGFIVTPSDREEFSYQAYLARSGIYSYIKTSQIFLLERDNGNPFISAIYELRELANDTIYKLYPDPEASLFAGILLGMDRGIPAPVMSAFNATGTSHIIAISGFNISILAALLAAIFGRFFNRWKAAVVTIAGISIYTILVGADSAVIRAAIMGGISLFAVQLGRRQDGLNSLAIAAAVMAIANPNVIGDLSFLLSFSATLGLVLYAEPLSEGFKRYTARFIPQETLEKATGYISEYILFTFAAQIATVPIIIYLLRRISLISIITNPVILPAQPPLMILGGLATIFGMISLPFGKFFAAFAWPFALYTIRIVEFFAHIPQGELFLGETALTVIILFYAALLVVTFSGENMKQYFSKLTPGILLGILLIISILIWQMALSQPDKRLHMTLLDVSSEGDSGNAIFIVTPTGRYVLIDGGPHTSLLSNELGRRMPLINRSLDWLVIANPNEEEIKALPRTIQRLTPSSVLWSGAIHGNSVSKDLWERLTKAKIPITMAQTGHVLDLGAGAELKTISTNNRGSVLLLEWRNFRALLPIGIDKDFIAQTDYGKEIGPVNVLLLAENGYIPVNPQEWIGNLNPQLILLSVAADDSSGMPSPETISNLAGFELRRTDSHGWIHISTDGEIFYCETGK